MSHPGYVVLAVLVLAAGYVLMPMVLSVYATYRERRILKCPATDCDAIIAIDARHAALHRPFSDAPLKVKSCSEWPMRCGCDQGCVASLKN
jgi:hypothetical protein